MVESVEVLFPGVERGTLTQIIENRFKPTNIYRLLATEKERAESQRMISIRGVEFEQTEREGKESEYRIMSFFKAWAVYTGILIKLAPYGIQGELATALAIYTMNLYELLEKYTWEGVRAYHFQFHRKRVASGKSIYHPTEWRHLDSELVASRCFAHPIPRATGTYTYKSTVPLARRAESTSRDSAHGQAYTYYGASTNPAYKPLEQRINTNDLVIGSARQPLRSTETIQTNGQACHNWNYRECRFSHCRYQH